VSTNYPIIISREVFFNDSSMRSDQLELEFCP
jgi:hypothetical protein